MGYWAYNRRNRWYSQQGIHIKTEKKEGYNFQPPRRRYYTTPLKLVNSFQTQKKRNVYSINMTISFSLLI
jgi:hypothetical protein